MTSYMSHIWCCVMISDTYFYVFTINPQNVTCGNDSTNVVRCPNSLLDFSNECLCWLLCFDGLDYQTYWLTNRTFFFATLLTFADGTPLLVKNFFASLRVNLTISQNINHNLKSNNNSRIIQLQKSIVKLKTKAYSLQIIESNMMAIRKHCGIIVNTRYFYPRFRFTNIKSIT